MKKYIFLAFISLLPMNSIAATEGDAYGGFQYAFGSYSEDGFPDLDLNAILVRFGKYLGNDVSIEGRFGIGNGDDTVTLDSFIGPVDVDFEVDTVIGVYGLKHFKTGQDSSVYGALGFSRVELLASALGESESADETGLSFGVGLQADRINLEFMQYLNKSDFDFTAISLGVMF